MKHLIFVLFFVGLTQSSFACCAEDNRTLTERLFNGDAGTIFTCRVLTFTKPDYGDNVFTQISDGSIDATATVKIVKVYFGKVDTNIVTLRAGSYLTAGKIYLIYTTGNGREFSFGGNCDIWSKEVDESPIVVNELSVLDQFSAVFEKKLSGNYKFLNSNNIVVAEGRFEKGKPINLWRHYYDSGIIKSEFDLDNSVSSQHYSNGFIQARQIEKKDTTIYENYCDVLNGEMTLRVTDVKDSSGEVVSSNWWEYNHEHYPNGRIKFSGLTSHGKRIGVWRFFNDNGEQTAEWDYKDGVSE